MNKIKNLWTKSGTVLSALGEVGNTRFKQAGPTKAGYWRTVPVSLAGIDEAGATESLKFIPTEEA